MVNAEHAALIDKAMTAVDWMVAHSVPLVSGESHLDAYLRLHALRHETETLVDRARTRRYSPIPGAKK